MSKSWLERQIDTPKLKALARREELRLDLSETALAVIEDAKIVERMERREDGEVHMTIKWSADGRVVVTIV